MAKIFPSSSRLLEIHVESKHQCLPYQIKLLSSSSTLVPKPQVGNPVGTELYLIAVKDVLQAMCDYASQRTIPQLLKFFRQSLSMTLASCCLEIPLSTSPTGPQCAKEACIFSEEV